MAERKKYLSPAIVNEQMSIMGLAVLRTLLDTINKCSPPWYAVVADEATDVANKEQFNLSIRWVSDDYDISEDPVGLYCLPNTKADTLHSVLLHVVYFHLICAEARPTMVLPQCKV